MQPRSGPVRIAVVNDFSIVVAGVAAMLAPFADRVRVVERHSGPELCHDVDLVLYDTFAAVRNPVEEIEVFRAESPARLVVFSWTTDPEQVQRCLEAGACGFLSKALAPIELVRALERIHAGEVLTPRAPTPTTVRQRGRWPGDEYGLTAREAEIVALITIGLSNQEIAERAFLSINSVKTYIRTAYRKMGVGTRAQAVLWGVRHGFAPSVQQNGTR